MKRKNIKKILILIIVFILAIIVFAKKDKISNIQPVKKQVELITVSDYQNTNATIFTLGQIESMQQVDLKAQIGGEVKKINVKIGDNVSKGDLLVELDHSNLDIQLKQAEANIEKANGALNQVIVGATEEQIRASKAKMDAALASYNNVQSSLEDLLILNEKNLNSTYDNASTAVEDSIIKMKNAYTLIDGIQKRYFVKNDQEGLKVRNLKNLVKDEINQLESQIKDSKNHEDIDNLINKAEKSSEKVFDALSEIKAISDSIIYENIVSSSEKAALETQKNYIHGVYSAMIALKNNISILKTSQSAAVKSHESNLEVAKNNYEALKAAHDLILADPREIDLITIKSSIKEAESAYDYIYNNIQKSFIRAPFSGKVSSVPAKLNSLTSTGMPVVSILNDSGLQAKVYISDKDIKLIKEGARVLINKNIEGIVSNIAPAIDPNTKKIEVNVTVTDSNDLIIGEYVNIDIFINKDILQEKYLLPLKSVLITPHKNYVFTLNDQGVIEKKEIKTANIINRSIEVIEGIDGNTKILKSVRGLKEGEEVKIKNEYE
jgi:RND family efflux transporter MFP subunit